MAAASPPPEEIPAKIPSSAASRRAISSLSRCETSMIRSTRVLSKILGRYSSGHLRMPGTFAPGPGCTPTTWMAGFISLRKREQPMIVPVVPMVATKCVTNPRVSRQISGPVPV